MKKPPRMKTIRKISTTAKRKAPVKKARASSSVEGHDYNPETGHLTVTFRGGRRYRYEGVDEKTAQGLRDADSQGSYLHAHVIGKFDHVKI